MSEDGTPRDPIEILKDIDSYVKEVDSHAQKLSSHQLDQLNSTLSLATELLRSSHIDKSISENSQVALLVTKAEEALVETPFYKFTRTTLIGVLIIGLIIWVGGAIYSGVQIASIQKQSESTLKKISDIERRVIDTESQIHTVLTQKVQSIDKAIEKSSLEINKKKEVALQKLDTDNLPDLRQLKSDVEILVRTGGELNLSAIYQIVNFSWWFLLGVAFFSAIISIICLVKMKARV